MPFLAADLGNFAGGGVSSWLIARGWRVGRARKAVSIVGALGMTLLAPTVIVQSFSLMVACFAIATFAYAALSTMILNLPADIYPTGSVATVSGLSGTGAGIGTIAATYLTGASRTGFLRAAPDRRQPDARSSASRRCCCSCGTPRRPRRECCSGSRRGSQRLLRIRAG